VLCAVSVGAGEPRGAGNAAADVTALAKALQALRAENPGSYQRFLTQARQAVSTALEEQPLPDVRKALLAQGFQLECASETSGNEVHRASLPRLDYALPGGGKLSFELDFMAFPEVSRVASTRWTVRASSVALRDDVNLPYARLLGGNRYPPGSILQVFFARKAPAEANRYPLVERVELEANGPRYFVSEEVMPGEFRPCEYGLRLDLVRKEGDRVLTKTLTASAVNHLEPYRSWDGKPNPEPFVPTDSFGSLSAVTVCGAGESGLTSGGLLSREDAPEPVEITPERAYSIADLRALKASTKEIQLLGDAFTMKDLAELSRFHQLESLEYLADWPAGSAKGSAWLAGLRALRRLRLSGAHVTDQTCLQIASIASLRVVDVSSGSITDGGVRRLLTLPRLEELSLPHCKRITNASLRLIGEKRGLKAVSLMSNDRLRGIGLRELGRLTGLTSLHVGNVTGATSADFRFLSRLTRLRELSLSYMPLDDRVVTSVSALTQLESLNLNELSGVTDTGLTQLRTLKRARWLAIQFCPKVTGEGLRRLQRLLPSLTLS